MDSETLPDPVPRLSSPVLEPLPGREGAGWRLRGRDAGGRLLQVDAFGRVPVAEPAAGLLAAPDRLFVHEDVVAAVEAVVPPRRVPWSRRLFWRVVLLLMRTRPTRDWLLRRYAR
jgi:hypothetical protein